GSSSATFTISVQALSDDDFTIISATYRGLTRSSEELIVRPASMSSLDLPFIIIAGTSAQATVKLDGAAPPGGAVIKLSSTAPDFVSVPASFTIPAGDR